MLVFFCLSESENREKLYGKWVEFRKNKIETGFDAETGRCDKTILNIISKCHFCLMFIAYGTVGS